MFAMLEYIIEMRVAVGARNTNQDGLTPKYGLLKKQPQHLEDGRLFLFYFKKEILLV